MAKSEQLDRYRQSLHNLILTNYLEFRWYVAGELRETASLGQLIAPRKIEPDKAGITAVSQLLTRFFYQGGGSIGRAEELAKRMAHLAVLMRDAILATYQREAESGPFHIQLQEFQETLIPNLDVADFADMYAQTLTYGLFAARVETPLNARFDRFSANRYLPQTNPFLRNFFWNIAGPNLPDTVAWLVDDLAHLLDQADMEEILRDFGRLTRQEDPIIHFYETFLREYDPALRQQRGVYYTPEPVVGYIVRSIDQILQTHFDRPLGLADKDTLILDPATGTATFLYFVIQEIYDKLHQMGQAGAWDEYVAQHLLPRLFGFELLMAPYAVAHLKLGMQLRQYGYTFGGQERLQIYLTNALDPAVKDAPPLGFAGMISAEGKAAARVKQDEPIMVILGNPPYSVSSANSGDYINGLMDSYKKAVRSERNIQPLSDDYIKFIRFAHDRIERTGYGIVGMITNHAYLTGLIHRGMREELLNSFSEIYVLDLHGNTTIGEVSPDGQPDQNVFDIRQGVAILFLVKHPGQDGAAEIYHYDLWGNRESKYRWLLENTLESCQWRLLEPSKPYFFLVPKDFSLQDEYMNFSKMTDSFALFQRGAATRRDHFMVAFQEDELRDRLSDFVSDVSNERIENQYNLSSTKYWNIDDAREVVRKIEPLSSAIYSYAYRPFDNRFVTYIPEIIERGDSAYRLMQHMIKPNLAILCFRRIRQDLEHVVFITNKLTDKTILSSKDNVTLFPLYTYTTAESTAGTLFATTETSREPNLAPGFIQAVSDKLGLTFTYDPSPQPMAAPTPAGAATVTPEDIFYYAYAIFHSPTYRERYAEFLKIDFPRLSLTSDVALFRHLTQLGHELVSLHLLQSPRLNNLRTSFPISGSNEVGRVRYVDPHIDQTGTAVAGRVYINKEQYVEGVETAVWQFQIGGYQVLHKWLKDRKGRTLTFDDIFHYQRIIIALAETMRLMAEIDEAIPDWPLT